MDTWWHLAIDLLIILILIAGIRQFRTPRGARSGNLTAAFALLCALGIVLYRNPVLEPAIVIAALVLGGIIALAVAMRVNMIQIPAMIAFQHGAGGVAAFLISFVELSRHAVLLTAVGKVSGILGLVIGAATFSGSMVASGKLANIVKQTPIVLPKHGWILQGAVVIIVAMSIVACRMNSTLYLLFVLLGLILLSMLLGVIFSIRIGGADMPVLVSFLNATAGLAAAFCGIIIQNRLLIACGATVAASGSILTHVMCRAMNRNLLNVFVGMGVKSGAAIPPVVARKVQIPESEQLVTSEFNEPEAPERNNVLTRAIEAVKKARKVVIIPGYGMALAQAQFKVVELANRLEEMGKEVKFAIHPVAGRMPGHMNVLLAEAEVDYDRLFEMDEINPGFNETDIALIVGACDVVNPAAISTEDTPISGMPIVMAHEAKQVVVCNLDEKPGYSGVENPLYLDSKTILLLGDAKITVSDLLKSLE